jgi:hypothetical protein
LWSVKIVEGNFIRSVSFTWRPSGLRGELRKAKYVVILFHMFICISTYIICAVIIFALLI